MPANNPPDRRSFLTTSGLVGGTLLTGMAAGARGEVALAPPDDQPPNLPLPEVVQRQAGWAIVGLGTLALGEIMPAFAECKYSRPVALVSGHADKAKKVADAYDIDHKHIYNYENYDSLADNEEVDAIYIVLPNSIHAEYTIRGHEADKHVLCEKPMAVTAEECERMIAAAERAKKKLMIAYRLRYEPFNMKVIDMCRNEELGKLKLISASNCQNVTPPNIRLSKELGGGPVGDVGVYCLNAARYITGAEPISTHAIEHKPDSDPRFREVPESVTFTLEFPDGILAHCDCSFGTAENRFYKIVCEKGVIELDQAFAYQGQRLFVDGPQGKKELQLSPVNHFAAEMDHFSQCILKDEDPRTPGADGLADMRAIEAIYEAAETGKKAKVSS